MEKMKSVYINKHKKMTSSNLWSLYDDHMMKILITALSFLLIIIVTYFSQTYLGIYYKVLSF